MKKHFILLLVVAMLLSFSAVAVAADDITDIPDGWSHDAVVAAIDNGLLQGYDGLVDPTGNLTRAQMGAIMVRALGATTAANISGFTDVPTNAWYYNSMAVAVGMGIFEGDGSALRPEDNITREQAALVLSRAFKLTDTAANLSGYQDAGQISSWARDGVAAMVKAGYMQGDGKTLNPTGNITREEFAQIMYNLVTEYIAAAGAYEKDVNGNLVIRAAGTTLDGVAVKGDVVIGDGVGNGDVTIKDCTISGRLLVRGGGVDTIYITGTNLSSVVVSSGGAVRVVAGEGASFGVVVVDDGKDQVVLEGEIGELKVEADVPVVIQDATVASVEITAAAADVTVAADAKVNTVTVAAADADISVAGSVNSIAVASGADNATVTAQTGGTVAAVTTAAAGVTVTGKGAVTSVTAQAGATDTAVSTPKTEITNNSAAAVSTASGEVAAGAKATTSATGGAVATTPPSSGGGGGSSHSSTTTYQLSLSITYNNTTVATSSSYLIGSSKLYVEAGLLFNSDMRSELNSKFSDPEVLTLIDMGIEENKKDASAWDAFVNDDTLKQKISGKAAFINKLKSKDVTLAEIVGSNTISFSTSKPATYQVTIEVTRN